MTEIENVLVFCITKGKGISRKSGSPRPYDFATMEYIVPATGIDMPDCTIISRGYQAKSLGIKNEPAVLATLANCPTLVPVTLVVEFDPTDFSKLLVVGFKYDKALDADFGGEPTAKAPVKDNKPVTESKF